MADAAPWFKFYPRYWLSGMRCRMLPPATRAAYIDLLSLQWIQGEIPSGDDLVAWLHLQGYERTELEMDRLLELFPGGRNEKLADERADMIARKRKLSEAGKRGAKKKHSHRNQHTVENNPKSHTQQRDEGRKGDHSQATATPEQSDKGGHSNKDVDVDRDVDEEKETPNAGASELSTRDVTPNVLVGAWIDLQPMRPAPADIKKQGAVAKRICSRYDDEAIHTACDGMAKLFPHSDGAPWDLFDLERKFPKAVQAAMNGGSRKHAWLDTMFDGIPDEGER